MKKIIGAILTGVILISSNSIIYAEDNQSIESKEKDVSEEEYLTNVSELKKLSFEEVYNKFQNKETFVLYLGRKTCPHCRAFSPVLKEFNILLDKKLNYYDIESPDLEGKAREFFGKLGVPAVPAILYVKEGKLVDGWLGGGITAQGLYDRFYKEKKDKSVEEKEIKKIDSSKKKEEIENKSSGKEIANNLDAVNISQRKTNKAIEYMNKVKLEGGSRDRKILPKTNSVR